MVLGICDRPKKNDTFYISNGKIGISYVRKAMLKKSYAITMHFRVQIFIASFNEFCQLVSKIWHRTEKRCIFAYQRLLIPECNGNNAPLLTNKHISFCRLLSINMRFMASDGNVLFFAFKCSKSEVPQSMRKIIHRKYALVITNVDTE